MTNYQVFVTPLIEAGTYGDEVDVTDWVDSPSLGEITRGIDSAEFTVGIYTYSDVTLVFDATDGYLAEASDSRSLFKFTRDKAKVRVVYLKDGAPSSTFEGIVDEAGSNTDVVSGTVSLVVMSYDSVLREAIVAPGSVTDGMSFKTALIAILNSVASGILSIDADDIEPVYNGVVDLGTPFDGKTAKQALDMLLLPANSILMVDSSQNVLVTSREESTKLALELFGPGDLLGRENCRLLSYNGGQQRMFNLIRVTGGQAESVIDGTTVKSPELTGIAQDAVAGEFFGVRIKEFEVPFVTAQETLDEIAEALLVEFRYPKPEAEIEVPTELLQAQESPTDLLDRVSLDYPLSVRPQPNCRLPIAGITTAGDPTRPLPFVEGAIAVDPIVCWKVIEMRESPDLFTTVLKLRVVGTETNDGFFEFLMTEDGNRIFTEDRKALSA